MAYCAITDLLTGDIPLASKYGDGSGFVNLAADEIDAQIGHIYITPVTYTTPADPANRPAQLLLKKINTLLASGRIILDMAAGSEDNNLHAYGASMVAEAIALLNQISSGRIVLKGPLYLSGVGDDPNTAVSIVNEDGYSLVKGFYDRYSTDPFYAPVYLVPMKPYDEPDTVTP